MKKVTIVFFVLIIALSLYIFLSSKYNRGSLKQPSPELTPDKIISDLSVIDLIITKQRSPKGNALTKMVIDSDDPNIMDEPWSYAYYTCSENEHSGWIHDYRGGDKEKPALYGPYEWCFQ